MYRACLRAKSADQLRRELSRFNWKIWGALRPEWNQTQDNQNSLYEFFFAVWLSASGPISCSTVETGVNGGGSAVFQSVGPDRHFGKHGPFSAQKSSPIQTWFRGSWSQDSVADRNPIRGTAALFLQLTTHQSKGRHTRLKSEKKWIGLWSRVPCVTNRGNPIEWYFYQTCYTTATICRALHSHNHHISGFQRFYR